MALNDDRQSELAGSLEDDSKSDEAAKASGGGNRGEAPNDSDDAKRSLSGLEKFNIVVGIFLSLATAAIGWKTLELTENANQSNLQLIAIEQKLADKRFDFDQIRDIYDRTEKYLSSAKQDKKRGRALIVLISSLPNTQTRSNLLSIVTVEASDVSVREAAAESYLGSRVPEVDPGSYYGSPTLVFLNDGRSFRLTSDFGFKDSNGVDWEVPAGVILSGASIPRLYWSTIGSPLTGKYQNAAILHEYYALKRRRSTKQVNEMFYEAMLASDVSVPTAKVIYTASVSFGPRWSDP